MQRKPLRRDARDSRDRLILTAERLFAERGIDGVSLRELNLAAVATDATLTPLCRSMTRASAPNWL